MARVILMTPDDDYEDLLGPYGHLVGRMSRGVTDDFEYHELPDEPPDGWADASDGE